MKLDEREKTALQAREEDRQTEWGLGEKEEGEIQIKEREREGGLDRNGQQREKGRGEGTVASLPAVSGSSEHKNYVILSKDPKSARVAVLPSPQTLGD